MGFDQVFRHQALRGYHHQYQYGDHLVLGEQISRRLYLATTAHNPQPAEDYPSIHIHIVYGAKVVMFYESRSPRFL